MSREWKPGDVVMDPDHGVALVVSPHFSGCPEAHRGRGMHIHYTDGDWNTLVARLRPLVVIDPEDREAVERLLRGYAGWTSTDDGIENYPRYVDDMQAALREFANPKPPKPEEPTGLGAVVEDADGSIFIRTLPSGDRPWQTIHGMSWAWADIDPGAILSEGVQP